MAEAAEILRELPGALHRGSWNMAIRRSQEVVELALKALLTEMGFDYPKVHDVAPQFRYAVQTRGLDVAEAPLTWLETVSGRLALRRAPAFYFEAEYAEAEARQAVADAEEVMRFSRALRQSLRGEER